MDSMLPPGMEPIKRPQDNLPDADNGHTPSQPSVTRHIPEAQRSGPEFKRQLADAPPRITLPPSPARTIVQSMRAELPVVAQAPTDINSQRALITEQMATLKTVEAKWQQLVNHFTAVSEATPEQAAISIDPLIKPPTIGAAKKLGVESAFNRLTLKLREIDIALKNSHISTEQQSSHWQEAVKQARKLDQMMAMTEVGMHQARQSLRSDVSVDRLRKCSLLLESEPPSKLYRGLVKTVGFGLKSLRLASWLGKAPFRVVETLFRGTLWTGSQLFAHAHYPLAIPFWIADTVIDVADRVIDEALELLEDVHDRLIPAKAADLPNANYQPLNNDRMDKAVTPDSRSVPVEHSESRSKRYAVDLPGLLFTAAQLGTLSPIEGNHPLPDPVSIAQLAKQHQFGLLRRIYQTYPEDFVKYPELLPDFIRYLRDTENWDEGNHLIKEVTELNKLIKTIALNAPQPAIEDAMLATIMIRARNPYCRSANGMLQTLETHAGYQFTSKPENHHRLAEELSTFAGLPIDIALIWLRHVPKPEQHTLLQHYPQLASQITKAYTIWGHKPELAELKALGLDQTSKVAIRQDYNEDRRPLLGDDEDQ